jgi:hypothetical protein
VGLEWGSLSLVSTIEELLGRKSSGSGLENREYGRWDPWPSSTSELYRPRDSSLSAKLVPTYADRGVSHGQRNRSPRPYSQISRPEPLLFLPSSSSVVLTRLSDPITEPLLLGKSGSVGNRTRDLWMCS